VPVETFDLVTPGSGGSIAIPPGSSVSRWAAGLAAWAVGGF